MFFLLTALSALIFMPLWLATLAGAVMVNPVGGAVLWHGHELIFGLMGAATAGFVLTAIAEFTGTTTLPKKALLSLALLWLLARGAYVLSPSLAWFFNAAFFLGVIFYIAPPAWRQAERKHSSFIWVLVLLVLLESGFFYSLVTDGQAQRWLSASVHVFMVLIIIAASRVSMSLINGVVESGKNPEITQRETLYVARPPRRNLAIVMILLCALAEAVLGANAATGYLALAAMAAMANLLNDWHVGRPLFQRFALLLYATYWLMILGYGLLGAAYLGAPLLPSAGHHLLSAGAMTLSTVTIMSIVARIHTGRWLDRRGWLLLAAGIVILAALLRAKAGFYSSQPHYLYLAGALWTLGFALWLGYFARILAGARADQQQGCAEPKPSPVPATARQ